MANMQTKWLLKNIHGTCICLQNKGVLLLGKSGSGKSDLALRLIENKNAALVADDRVDLFVENKKIFAAAPESIKGLLEIRGIGIVKKDFINITTIDLVVELVQDLTNVERMPSEQFWEIDGVKIPLFSIYPFEPSAPDKIVIKLKALLD